MGRRLQTTPAFQNRLRAARLARGLSQAELAAQSGLARQAIGAIELGAYVPNTLVSLAIARALGCSVEALFTLAENNQPQPVRLASDAAGDERRLAVARVRDRWVGHPLRPEREIDQGVVAASALLPGTTRLRTGQNAMSALLVPREIAERTALLLGCDPSLGLLAAHLSVYHKEVRLAWLSAASEAALNAVRDGAAHVAGSHLHDPETGVYNLPYARRALATTGGLIVAFASWEQGFVLAHGNPKSIHRVEDLIRPDVRVINRESGAGSRALLDELREAAGIAASSIAGYNRTAGSHQAVAMTVAAGGADVGVALRATARALGLEFVPLVQARFDLVVPADHVEHPAVAALLELLQTRALRSDVRALAGYDADQMGTVLETVVAAA